METKRTVEYPTEARVVEIRAFCEQEAEKVAKQIGASAWHNHGKMALKGHEAREVMHLWKFHLPGSCSWTDAFLIWLQEAKP